MIQPFQGWVYREVPHVSPVRDALSPTLAEPLRKDPANALHIAFPIEPSRMVEIWEYWLKERILLREPLPVLYAYSQTFHRYGHSGGSLQRVGVLGILPIEAPILPHEAILPERLEGIQRAIQTLPVQATPVHLLCEGAWEELFPLLRSYLTCPRFSYGGADGVMHRWTPIHHMGHQRKIQEALAAGPYYIADGHHRWGALKAAGQRYMLVYVSPVEDISLIVAPTHRLLETNDSPLPLLEEYFTIRPSAARVPLWQEIQGLRHAIGVVAPDGQAFTARLRPAYWEFLKERPLISWLHTWILDKFKGLLTFSREPSAVIQAALEGKGWAFILSELSFSYVRRAAEEGWTLPPKTTYFFPKVLSGLCFYYEGHIGIGFSAA